MSPPESQRLGHPYSFPFQGHPWRSFLPLPHSLAWDKPTSIDGGGAALPMIINLCLSSLHFLICRLRLRIPVCYLTGLLQRSNDLIPCGAVLGFKWLALCAE